MALTFDQFLASSKTALAHLVDVAVEFAKAQTAAPVITEGGTVDPPMRHAGDPVVLTSKVLSQEEIDSVISGYAEGIVKEKAIEYVKGFLTGVTVAGGGL